DIDRHWRELGSDLPRSGLRAWLFHATTGYSVPYAVRLADRIAAAPDMTSRSVARLVEGLSREVWSEQSFMRLINRLFFVGAHPHERVSVMARFYKLNQGLIERFYAGRSSLPDKARVLSGKPPIPITRGLGVIPPERAWAHVAGRGDLREKLG
ncbi:MAG: lycopene cyclase family protein, partial [Pseudomonadota bacterium]